MGADFAASDPRNDDQGLMLDQIAARYGCRPSELVNGSMADLLIDWRCFLAHKAVLKQLHDRARADREPIQKVFLAGEV